MAKELRKGLVKTLLGLGALLIIVILIPYF